MADALISFLIEQLASTALDQIKEKVRLVSEVEESVEDFANNLQTIQVVLNDAEKRRVKEDAVQVWLDKLKGVSYDMDNVLDEWNTQALKQQIQKQEKENALVNKKKVRFSIPSPSNCFCFGQGSCGIVVRHDIAQNIKDLNSRLTKIVEEKRKYEFQSTTTGGIEQSQRPKTSSLVDVSKIFGREHEKHTLISMLLGHSTSTGEEERGPLVIPVVGMGGMGKTTLAQLAYNDENVKTHFKDLSKWVCVSDPFDEIKIAKSIISNSTPTSDELDDLMQTVSKSVEGKKFLLVLDDVWTEDESKWEQLNLALMSGAKGSRILVTTRKVTVARMMGATTRMIHLEKLSEQICSSLFYHIAFLDREKDKSNLFEAIGNEIVKKCNGLPLAAKTLGSLMRYKNTLQKWHDVLNSEMWEIKEVEQSVFRPLLLSYYDLTSEIKRCLLFCASFPKDHKINKDNLIELWMSQNYLTLERNQEKRAVGQEYFDDLVMRSFFQDFQMDNYENIKSCKMHDIVHDFVQFLTRNECFIIEASDGNQATMLSSDSVHHLTLMLAAEGPLSLPAPFHTCKNLRSLTIFNNIGVTRIDGDLILQLKCLRALNLSECNVKEVPKEIGELLHLRYIDLSWNYWLKELPDAMCNLCNLETLHLEWCESLEKLPKAMGKLINLKHLYLDGCDNLSCMPKGVGRLRGVRILDRFVCGGGDDKEILEFGDLGSFDHLQGTLEIAELGNVKDAREQAQKAQLEKKKHLLGLKLDFGDNDGEQQQRITSLFCNSSWMKIFLFLFPLIDTGVPSPKQRLEILHVLVSEMEHCLSDVQVQQLANATHGFVGSDLAALCNEAALSSLRRYVNFRYPLDYLHRTAGTYEGCSNSLMVSDCLEDATDMSRDYSDTASSSITHLGFSSENCSSVHLKGTNADDDIEEELKVAFEDFENARMKVRPSAMREVIVEVPKVNWEDVGGQTEVKNQLIEAVMWPQKHQNEFKRIGISPPTGVLLFGPPGCSKTLMARAVASEARLNFLSVKGPELYSKWVGESEKAVRSVFTRARANAPAIIFFDEIDGLAAIRGKENDGVSVSDRVISQLLVEMDGLQERVDVTVIAATNRPDKIDSALLRPGRFDRLLYVGPPDETDREEIFRIHLNNMKCSYINRRDLARLAEGYTGADIKLICREAGLAAIEESLCRKESLDALEIKMQHLETAIRQVKPTKTQFYQELSGKFQRLVHSNSNPGNLS